MANKTLQESLKLVRFDQLEIGDTFWFDRIKYKRIALNSTKYGRANVRNVQAGTLHIFNGDEGVCIRPKKNDKENSMTKSPIMQNLGLDFHDEIREGYYAGQQAAIVHFENKIRQLKSIAGWIEAMVRIVEELEENDPLPDKARQVLGRIKANIRTLERASNEVWYEIRNLARQTEEREDDGGF